MSANNIYGSLVNEAISLHDNPDFQKISTFISKSVINKSESWFTKERYEEVCDEIKKEIGSSVKIEHVVDINRKLSTYTLWKTKYSKCEDDVLWHIYFDGENKITAMAVDWGQI